MPEPNWESVQANFDAIIAHPADTYTSAGGWPVRLQTWVWEWPAHSEGFDTAKLTYRFERLFPLGNAALSTTVTRRLTLLDIERELYRCTDFYPYGEEPQIYQVTHGKIEDQGRLIDGFRGKYWEPRPADAVRLEAELEYGKTYLLVRSDD